MGGNETSGCFPSARLGVFLAFALLSVGRSLAVSSNTNSGCYLLSICSIRPLAQCFHTGPPGVLLGPEVTLVL